MMTTGRFPAYTDAERAADRYVHVAGLALAPLAVTALLAGAAAWRDVGALAVCAVYGAGLLAMVVFSAWYNLARDPARREVLRRYDHAAIYLLIAGTYTPFAGRALPAPEGTWLLAAVWGVAAGGVALKLLAPRRLEA
ncbi:MAG: hemolysin III family protein, partial [Alphaproteobacteria bacterium]|nr:hemolysin III family protein [Alphaproteobacteria bacterium]